MSINSLSLLTRSTEIDFPQFTSKLINDVFDSIITSNLNQLESYFELIESSKKNLSTFVSDTKDSIGGDLILQFLTKVIPDKASPLGTKISADSTSILSVEEATAINNSVLISELKTTPPANSTRQIKDLYLPIIDAVSRRIAANKYYLIQELAKLGALKLTIQEGELESRVAFNTYESNFYTNNTDKYNRNESIFSNKTQNSNIITNWINYSFYSRKSNIHVSTPNSSNSLKESNSSIFGGVKLKFTATYENL